MYVIIQWNYLPLKPLGQVQVPFIGLQIPPFKQGVFPQNVSTLQLGYSPGYSGLQMHVTAFPISKQSANWGHAFGSHCRCLLCSISQWSPRKPGKHRHS